MTSAAQLCAVDIRIGDTLAKRIAKDMTVSGKGVIGQCLPYAQALHARFCSVGIRSKILIFNYQNLSSPATNGARCAAGAHAVVAFEDGGRIYIADNQSWLPVWIQEAAPASMAQQFSGKDLRVVSARVMPDGRPERTAMRAAPRLTFASLQ